MPGPYATAAATYWRAGWRGILPLPYKAKKNPPRGFTGSTGVDPSYADVDTWATGADGDGNIALRLPRGVLGIDVDAYGDKPGALTLESAESEHGTLPPTWRTTSRDDGVSGIRLYRIPEGLAWPGEIGPATELIQYGHRYAIVWPSVHPEGRTYRWITPDGVVSATPPDVDALPLLPQEWVDGLTRGVAAEVVNRDDASAMTVAKWILELPHAQEPMCDRMEKAVEQMLEALPGSAHNAARDMALRCIRLGHEGHYGIVSALQAGRDMFISDATSAERTLLGKARRTGEEAAREWADVVTSAGNYVTANPSAVPTCDCFGQITGGILAAGAPKTPVDGSLALAPEPDPRPAGVATDAEPEPEEASSRLKDGATFILDVPAEVPAIWGFGDQVYWAVGEALMIVGPPGVGKTTLTGQILRGLLGLQDAVLGLGVTPARARVLYLAMDRPAQIARALRRAFSETERDVLAENLRVWEGPPPGDIAKHTNLLVTLAQLAGADTIIVDSLKDAAVGLTEDEVGAGYNRARQTALAAGIQVLELHHLVKRGAGGGKPTTLADVYGSAWLTAGVGSVLMLWGSAGDPIVQAYHLKQPASEIGPYRIEHDHETGTTSIFHASDVLDVAAAAGPVGVTAKGAASVMYEVDSPSEAECKKAQRALDRYVREGRLRRVNGSEGGVGGTTPTRWFIVDNPVDRAPTGAPTGTDGPISGSTDGAPTGNSICAGQSTDGSTDATDGPSTGHRPPLYKGGTGRAPATITREIGGKKYTFDAKTRQLVDPDTGELR